MTRGIQLKSLSATDLGYLGLPADTLADALEMLEEVVPIASDSTPDLRAVTHEVRVCLEETLALLTEALPLGRR